MVECECVPFAYGVWWIPGFNRYMVECESGFAEIPEVWQEIVLIDTWWNVN